MVVFHRGMTPVTGRVRPAWRRRDVRAADTLTATLLLPEAAPDLPIFSCPVIRSPSDRTLLRPGHRDARNIRPYAERT